jgi:phosphate:Na+ symporter
MFNTINTLLFFPFVNQFALLVGKIIKDSGPEKKVKHYTLHYSSGTFQNAVEMNILRAEKEMRDMAGIVSSMYSKISKTLAALKDNPDREKATAALAEKLREKEAYADEMRDELTNFLMECTRQKNSEKSGRRISRLMQIVASLENMTDDCYNVSILLHRSIQKDRLFTGASMKALVSFTRLVGKFLNFVQAHLGSTLTPEEAEEAKQIESRINKTRNRLRKYGRKRIQAGENVNTELLFIDFIRRLEHLGDYCFHISNALAHLDD